MNSKKIMAIPEEENDNFSDSNNENQNDINNVKVYKKKIGGKRDKNFRKVKILFKFLI